MKYRELINDCDEAVKRGDARAAARKLRELNPQSVPREYRLELAGLCRRAFLWPLGLRLLSPILHPERGDFEKCRPSAKERVEYALLLQKIGSVAEALRILQEVEPAAVAEAPLYIAYCRFAQWDYADAIPKLREFIGAQAPSYPAFVASVNLAAAYISNQNMDAAADQIEVNIVTARAKGHKRLLGNSLEMRAQIHLHFDRISAAKVDLEEAAAIFGEEQSFDRLFVQKWQAVLEGFTTRSAAPILDFRDAALRLAHWESVREADLFALKLQFDDARYDHLIFGTPYAAYRRRMASVLQRQPERTLYVWGEGMPHFDLVTGRSQQISMNPGKKIHQLLEIFLRDFYRPLRFGSLFSELFPGEHFDIESSPARVHQTLRRARRYFETSGLPLAIHEADGNYSLLRTGPVSFAIPLLRAKTDDVSARLALLRNRFAQEEPFTAADAATAAGLSIAGFHRLAKSAMDRGQLLRSGTGNSFRYQFGAKRAA